VKALITGGAGFIGSHLADQLLQDGDEVFVLDDLSTGTLSNVAPFAHHPRFHLVVDSVLHPAVVNELVNKVDVVYHLAAAVGVRTIVEQPVRTLRVNLEGTETVLGACCRFERPVLLASTSEVYGDHRSEQPLDEQSRRIYGATTQKRWAYADSKAMDEFLALAYREEEGLDAVIVRLFNTVGPRQTGQYGMVIPRFVERALAGNPIEIYGDGQQTRCFCHVQDTIRALRDLMTNLERTAGEIFNVGAKNQISIAALADTIKRMTRSSSATTYIPFDEVYGTGIEDMLHRVPCTDKIRSATGWAPTRSLEQILADVVAHLSTSVAIAA
jgi:UDP-glucose 4-epimerase